MRVFAAKLQSLARVVDDLLIEPKLVLKCPPFHQGELHQYNFGGAVDTKENWIKDEAAARRRPNSAPIAAVRHKPKHPTVAGFCL
jgi:hypothetical protein